MGRIYFKYNEFIDKNTIISTFPYEVNQFSSSFWIERRWIFEVEIESNHIYYCIRPYKRCWYEGINCSKLNRLDIIDANKNHSDDLLMKYLQRILTISSIYHLKISDRISFDLLIQILISLPGLASLEIFSMSSDEIDNIDLDENHVIYSLLRQNRITKVYLQKVNFLQIAHLIPLCPFITCLILDTIDYMDLEFLVGRFLENINEFRKYLCVLSVHVPAVDDQTMNNLEKMISDKKLLINCRCKRAADRIYLSWD